MMDEACGGNSTVALRDFDWKLRYVIGSSKIAALGAPMFALNLHCSEVVSSGKENSGIRHENYTQLKTITMEMSKTELKSLLATLEKAEENLKLNMQG